jgi:hypothetical protein
MLTWIHTPGVGYCATLPDKRVAYVQPCRTKPGQWVARVVKRPGHRGLADIYQTKPTPELAMRWVEALKAAQPRRAA